jgi:protein kinase C substrate 80K-H
LTRELNNLNNDIRKDTETLEKMSQGYGPDAEWKKLDGTCIDKVHGEYVERTFCADGALTSSYTYELCFFGRATQKSNKDSSSNFLGYVVFPLSSEQS